LLPIRSCAALLVASCRHSLSCHSPLHHRLLHLHELHRLRDTPATATAAAKSAAAAPARSPGKTAAPATATAAPPAPSALLSECSIGEGETQRQSSQTGRA